MKTILLLFALFFNQMNAQNLDSPDGTEVRNAEFVGGHQQMLEYIAQNLNYPLNASARHVEGSVTLTLTIDTAGVVRDVKVRNGLGQGCDEEARRVVETMPKWKPALLNGKPIASGKTLRIDFFMPR